MAPGNPLVFQGTRWLKARIVNAQPMVFRAFASDFDRQPASRTIFTIAASGRGRVWSAAEPKGFWRDFTEIDLGDSGSALQFLRRHGDPDSLLETGAETHTGHWSNLAALLSVVARAYEPANADGISNFTTDPERIGEARWFLRGGADIGLLKMIEPIPDPSGRPRVVLRAKTLAAFMALSAAHAIEHRPPMRRCARCGSWFFIGRSDAQFCSASCRSASFNANKEIVRRGEHQKEDQFERPTNLAVPLARTGAKRERSPANKELFDRPGRKGARGEGRAGDRAPRRGRPNAAID
jgi:hypothetical protein